MGAVPASRFRAVLPKPESPSTRTDTWTHARTLSSFQGFLYFSSLAAIMFMMSACRWIFCSPFSTLPTTFSQSLSSL